MSLFAQVRDLNDFPKDVKGVVKNSSKNDKHHLMLIESAGCTYIVDAEN